MRRSQRKTGSPTRVGGSDDKYIESSYNNTALEIQHPSQNNKQGNLQGDDHHVRSTSEQPEGQQGPAVRSLRSADSPGPASRFARLVSSMSAATCLSSMST